MFAFLVETFDFIGPETSDDQVSYYSPSLAVHVAMDPRDGLLTFAEGHAHGMRVSAELACLYVEAGLGPAQRVRTAAGSVHAVRKSLGSQAFALRELLPILLQPEGTALLSVCRAR